LAAVRDLRHAAAWREAIMVPDEPMDFGEPGEQRVEDIGTDYLLWCLLECHRLPLSLRYAIIIELKGRGINPDRGRRTAPACERCGPGVSIDYCWVELRHGRRRIRRTCRRCDRHLGFAPLFPSVVSQANAAVSETALLDVLIAAHDLGVELRNDGRSVEFASAHYYYRSTPELRRKLGQVRCTLATMMPRTVLVLA